MYMGYPGMLAVSLVLVVLVLLYATKYRPSFLKK